MLPSTGSSSHECAATSPLSTMSAVAPQKERRRRRSCAASSATSHGRSSPSFASRGSRYRKLLDRHRSINALAESFFSLLEAIHLGHTPESLRAAFLDTPEYRLRAG